ncbi:MAG: hypothetical protein U0172_15015 [Nitrospiraceae bacterium]
MSQSLWPEVKTIFAWMKLSWLAACCTVLALIVFQLSVLEDSTARGESLILAALAMTILAAPLGILWLAMLSAMGVVLPLDAVANGPVTAPIFYLGVWMGFVTIGYFQWFKLLPWGVRTFREREAILPGKESDGTESSWSHPPHCHFTGGR